MIRTLESLYSRPMQLKGFTARYGKRPKQRGFYKRYGIDEVDLPGNREHIKEMDPASSKLGFDSSATLHKIWGQDENRLVIFNPKSKESTGVEIGKGKINGSVPPPPLPNSKSSTKKLLRLKNGKLNKNCMNQINQTEFKLHSHY